MMVNLLDDSNFHRQTSVMTWLIEMIVQNPVFGIFCIISMLAHPTSQSPCITTCKIKSDKNNTCKTCVMLITSPEFTSNLTGKTYYTKSFEQRKTNRGYPVGYSVERIYHLPPCSV
jgi:hypothetical protein